MKIFIPSIRDASSHPKGHRPKTSLRIAAASSAVLLLAGCQAFESRPLSLSAHDQKWRAQGPSSEEVQAFAKRLAQTPSGTSAFNLSNGVSLNEGKMIALVYNPDLRVARLKAGVSKAISDHAGLWDDPELSLDVLKITESVSHPWVVGSSLAFTLPLSGRLSVEKNLAEATMFAELDRVAESEWQISIDLQKAWIEWSALRTELEQTRTILETLVSIVKSTTLLAEQRVSRTFARNGPISTRREKRLNFKIQGIRERDKELLQRSRSNARGAA